MQIPLKCAETSAKICGIENNQEPSIIIKQEILSHLLTYGLPDYQLPD
ncbi:hypothetical protein SAMN06297358_2439 [Pedobacter xixiisoli]|uniref:Uncharacterized protein n=1 Tax=Pedobacter xixiisoli TaxID=1476464 RepID=A0A286A0N0_9SPHI|nr:hypothetical protein SAMN06297358_2439 [Pedobacter xixiisoli]